MAQIIEMQPFSRLRPIRETFVGNAEIMFFMGVRYERVPDAPPVVPAPQPVGNTAARRGRKRRA